MRYGFLGCGNMGGAIARALSASTKDILLANRSAAKAEALAAELGVRAGSNEAVLADCEVIFLGVKPQMLPALAEEIRGRLNGRKPFFVSMAAGITLSRLEELLGSGLPILRIMPNTPVAVGKGLILYCANDRVEDAALRRLLVDLAPAGALEALPEALIDAGSALSGCGPAYVYMFLEALADGAVACGLPRKQALRYAALTLEGASRLALESGKHPEQLKDEVCSPGGSTIKGVEALEQYGFRAASIAAVSAAFEKTKELGKPAK